MYQRRLIQVWSVISEQLASVCSVKRIIYMDQGLSKKQGEGRKTFYNSSCCFIDTPNLKHLFLFS